MIKSIRHLLLIVFFALPAHPTNYYDSLEPEDKEFFSAHFSLDDLYGDQNHRNLQKLCALIPSDEEKNQFLSHWNSFCEEKNHEDTIGMLSHCLRSSLLHPYDLQSLQWKTASFEIIVQAHLHGLDITQDYVFNSFVAPLFELSKWSPEQELPYDVLSQIHPHVTRALNMGSVSLMEAKSYQKPVEWYLKTYQTYADALENAAAFYMVPHTAKTPRTLFTKDNYNSPEKYFSTFATIGHVIAGIFKARIHFLKTHAPEIDALLKVGFTPCKQGFSLPEAKLDEKWHDLRPVDYYFKPQGDQLEEERPLFFALPKVLESKQALERKQLPNASWTDPIKQMIQAYHGLRKKDKATLENRINILNQISKTAEHLLQDASSAQTLSSIELEHLQELATVARNKSEYLSQIEVSLICEDRRRNLIPQDSLATTSIEIRRSNKLSEIYNDLDPAYRFHPYIYDYEELKEGKYIYPDLKLQKVTPFLEINEDEFIREEEDGSYHHKLSDQVDHLFDLKFSQLSIGKPVPPYFLWLENKNTLHTPRDLRRSVPQRDMLLEVNNARAFNKIFVSPDHPVILDGVYLYTIPEDGKIYIFPGDRSDKLAMKEENAKLHEIARRTYGVDFEEFSTRTIHPLLCKGSNVFTAGEIKFKDGKIIHLNNFSGHYTPFDYHLLNGLKRLLPSYNLLFSPDATVRCLSKKPLPYQQFMDLDVSVLKDAFLREIGNS